MDDVTMSDEEDATVLNIEGDAVMRHFGKREVDRLLRVYHSAQALPQFDRKTRRMLKSQARKLAKAVLV